MDPIISPEDVFRRYQELQRYVGWTEEDTRRVNGIADLVALRLSVLADDFYLQIERHPETSKVIAGGEAQIERLKGTLLRWLHELLTGPYDAGYVTRRWRAGWRHVEIGLDQVYTNVALSRLRTGLVQTLQEAWNGDAQELEATVRSLNTLLDLDLALIEDAYQAEYMTRVQRSERLAAIGQVAAAKQRSDAAFRTLVEAAPCIIVILRPDYSILFFSRFAEEITGHHAEVVIGQDYLSLFIPIESREAAVSDLHRVLRGTPMRGVEFPVLCRDGSCRWMIWNVESLPDYEGAPALVAIGQDITTLKQAQERTLQAERLAAIGQMVTGLAHESGNALARSQACLEMLALEIEDRPEALSLVTRIQTAQDHLRQLYEEVRGYAAPLKLDREVFDVRNIWRQAWTNLEMLRRGRDAHLHECTNGVDLRCPVDPFRLQQVFRNVLENSLAACHDPTEVTVACSEVALDAGRRAIRVSVRDNGPGLSSEQRQRIFEPFFTTKTKGTGLGMAIAKRIIEAHGGSIEVGQGPAPGAEISITLPRESA